MCIIYQLWKMGYNIYNTIHAVRIYISFSEWLTEACADHKHVQMLLQLFVELVSQRMPQVGICKLGSITITINDLNVPSPCLNKSQHVSSPASMVFVVKGRVGFVEEGNTFGRPQTCAAKKSMSKEWPGWGMNGICSCSRETLMISGAWPPPAPSVW